jgi:hypothetical protein
MNMSSQYCCCRYRPGSGSSTWFGALNRVVAPAEVVVIMVANYLDEIRQAS